VKVHDCLADTARAYKPYKVPQMPDTIDSIAISQEIKYLKGQKQMLVND